MSNAEAPRYKIVFLGEINVGKTSIIMRFMYNTFETNYEATIGIDFLHKIVTVANQKVRLQLWDTAGQERFRSLLPSYIRDSHIIMVCYDVTNMDSFARVDHWIADIRKERGEEVLVCIVGNKTDLEGERVVTTQMGQQKADDYEGVLFFETSAKDKTNVNELFYSMACKIVELRPLPPSLPSNFGLRPGGKGGSSLSSKCGC